MSTEIRIKICGVTSAEDALGCARAGADAIGLNFWPRSKRRCALDQARAIQQATDVRVVGVFVDARRDEIERVRAETGIEWVQLHGAEPPSMVEAFAPRAYKAVHVTDAGSLERALAYPGGELLVDASRPGLPGGTGQTCDWELAAQVASARRVWLAGGLDPGNVAAAIARVRPHGVDVASGVERAPGVKDLDAVRAFIAAARA